MDDTAYSIALLGVVLALGVAVLVLLMVAVR